MPGHVHSGRDPEDMYIELISPQCRIYVSVNKDSIG